MQLDNDKRHWLVICYLMISLCLFVSSEAKTKVTIRGLVEMSESEALNLLGGRFEHVLSGSPSASRADDAAYLLQRELRKAGYPRCKVSWSLPPAGNVILLSVDQGQPRYVGEVTVVGVDEDLADEVQAYFKRAPIGSSQVKRSKVPLLGSSMKAAREDASALLESRGFWSAEVKSERDKSRDDNPREDYTQDITVTVSEGPLFTLGRPVVSGANEKDTNIVYQLLGDYTGAPATTQNIKACYDAVQHYFRDDGYPFSKVDWDKELGEKQMTLIFQVDPGEKYILGNVSVEGTEKTRPRNVSRPFKRYQGAAYDDSVMDKQRKELLARGAFDSVLFELYPQDDGTIDVTLRVREGRARGVSFFAGAGSFEGAIFGMAYYDRNFLGRLWNLTIAGEYSGLGLFGQASVTDPWFLGSDMDFTGSMILISHDFEGYSKVEAGVGIQLEWDITENYSWRAYSDLTYTDLSSTGLPSQALGYQSYVVNKIGLSQRLDFRDNAINPKKGFNGEVITEFGAIDGKTIIPYFKAELRSSYRQVINKKSLIMLGARVGSIWNNDSQNFPIDQRYFVGGSDSVRSFPDRELGPQANGYPTGGESFWVANIEYIRQAKGPIYVVAFADAGALALGLEDLDNTDPKYALGLGLRLDLPVGPVRMEYGYNLNREEGEPRGTLHFAVGVTF
ncbi:BamA/OMP85 family outer membrane protein [Persicirhabdus sediminis]|uniref:BamA/TamA family outer membrane protein n=1 Tax=Persicirhabdus sediminis TaxID=454144 RepID=A0A8J7SNM2_9BACT|nr:BamA/TamA family outer membrane protein [Persicirhabdus sediminis]MBK1791763.1 BamA/TamA family outer membrane protein [Persicirhabdus sediminis]